MVFAIANSVKLNFPRPGILALSFNNETITCEFPKLLTYVLKSTALWVLCHFLIKTVSPAMDCRVNSSERELKLN